jgi:uncharacterized protein YndB with AHSA1/START domain
LKAQVIYLHACMRCEAEEAFSYFTDNGRLQEWLTEVADVEPMIGGKYELFWEPTERESNSTIGCRITGLTPGRLIAFEWKSPKQFERFANTADPLTHVVITFFANGDRTEVNLVHSGWRSTPEWKEAQAWQENAWRSAFERLEEKAGKR